MLNTLQHRITQYQLLTDIRIRTMNVNVKGVWLSMKYEIAQMLKQGSKSKLTW